LKQCNNPWTNSSKWLFLFTKGHKFIYKDRHFGGRKVFRKMETKITFVSRNSAENYTKSFFLFSIAWGELTEHYFVNYHWTIRLVWMSKSCQGFHRILEGIHRYTILHLVGITGRGESNLKVMCATHDLKFMYTLHHLLGQVIAADNQHMF